VRPRLVPPPNRDGDQGSDPWSSGRLHPEAQSSFHGSAPEQSNGQHLGGGGCFGAPRPAGREGGEDLSAKIFASLSRLKAGGAVDAGDPSGSEREPDLSMRLRDSLRHLLPAGDVAAACNSSAAGQQLLHVVQQLAPDGSSQMPAAQPLLQRVAPPPAAAAAPADFLGGDGEPMRIPVAGGALPRPEHAPRELMDDSSGDEGVPHRLPPGFGAIPEDLVEERARQREEERVRRIKATQSCRFGRTCKKRDCPNAHPEGRTIDSQLNPCAFGRRCKRKDCFYDHPDGREMDVDPSRAMCKYGVKCRRVDCLYDHPPGREPVDSGEARICYFCHEVGHKAGDCPRNPGSWAFSAELAALQGPPPAGALTNSGEPEENATTVAAAPS